MLLGMVVGLGPGHIALDGDAAPLPKKEAQPPIFGPCLLWPNGWMHQDATWYGGRPWPRPHCARWRCSSPTKRGHRPQFSAHFYCRQTSVCIKMPLGMVVGLGPGHIVLDGDAAPPIFGPCLLLPNGWMDQDATWYGGMASAHATSCYMGIDTDVV